MGFDKFTKRIYLVNDSLDIEASIGLDKFKKSDDPNMSGIRLQDDGDDDGNK